MKISFLQVALKDDGESVSLFRVDVDSSPAEEFDAAFFAANRLDAVVVCPDYSSNAVARLKKLQPYIEKACNKLGSVCILISASGAEHLSGIGKNGPQLQDSFDSHARPLLAGQFVLHCE